MSRSDVQRTSETERVSSTRSNDKTVKYASFFWKPNHHSRQQTVASNVKVQLVSTDTTSLIHQHGEFKIIDESWTDKKRTRLLVNFSPRFTKQPYEDYEYRDMIGYLEGPSLLHRKEPRPIILNESFVKEGKIVDFNSVFITPVPMDLNSRGGGKGTARTRKMDQEEQSGSVSSKGTIRVSSASKKPMIDIDSLTVEKLKVHLKRMGVTDFAGMRKPELVALCKSRLDRSSRAATRAASPDITTRVQKMTIQ